MNDQQTTATARGGRPVSEVDNVIIRFAGDSGDGIQITGAMFSHDSATEGHDISTLPDFPAEIRAPAGTLAGVSSFQLNFSSYDVHTPGDRPDMLVALNPAALKAHIGDLRHGGTVVVNNDAFGEGDLKKAGYGADPREDGSLNGYTLYSLPISMLTAEAVKPAGLSKKQAELCKNMFTLGMVCWLYDRALERLNDRIEALYAKKRPQMAEANKLALLAGYNYADTVEVFMNQYRVRKAVLAPGKYRRITGNEASALGFLAAAELTGLPLLYASYPITPASDILHELSRLRHFGVRTVQAEDEIAAMGMAIGAAYGGALGLTGTSGPGVALKSEAIGLAVMAELPVVIANVQRAGPSTGMPTKTEQADLLQAMFGRNGECPVAIVAPATPADCFAMSIEAFRIAVKYMTPVFVLSDGYLANGSEPWRIPTKEDLPPIQVDFATDPATFRPYARDPDTLSRPWAVPGTPGLEHRIGGIEKQDITGEVSYNSANHEKMVHLRAEKIRRIAADIPPLTVRGPAQGDLLVLGWGGTAGAIRHAVENAQKRGLKVAAAHLRYLNPFPANIEQVLRSYRHVLLPELNLGQLRMLLRAEYLIDVIGLNKVQGQPFLTSEIEDKIYAILGAELQPAANQ
ncbi:MAG: 2-oxoacid:acceptor oxidoreductase subunit alpha [Gammaproteobacteria bacterium]|nr:2-oxoacid:acceptor oxidoreductase subunit alpha [Gammaproteobacteria bacterium]